MLTQAFQGFISDAQYKQSLLAVSQVLGVSPEDVTSDENIPEFIQLAQEGDDDALMVLYRQSVRMIAHTFFKNFLGPNKRVWKRRVDNGDAELFATEAWFRMEKALSTFDVEKYERGRGNILGKWHYWLGKYLAYMAQRINRERKREGFVDAPTAPEHALSSSLPTDDKGQERYSVSLSDPGHSSEIETEDALTSYKRSLSQRTDNKSEQLFDLLSARLEGQDLETIADDWGVSKARIYGLMRELKKDMFSFGVFENVTAANNTLQESYGNVPDWEPFTSVTISNALRFRKRNISDHITHHISPCYLVVETKLPNRKVTYTLYLRLPAGKGTQIAKREYANNVDLLVTNHRSPRVVSMSQAKSLLRDHYNSGGRVKGGVDPSSPQHWIGSLSGR